ncbi:MAG: D-sedoheptulose 7-phosphate isomerase [Chloroflexi bacterium]|nr:MAG: D-sedoheptulose 7-phosphate isomerase [Chloroflexota bacterium]
MLHEQLLLHSEVMQSLITIAEPIEKAVEMLIGVISRGNKILICGNGGSAADAQHFAAEIVGRFKKERQPWPAIALTTDTSILTAVGNDYGFEAIFSRQVEGLGRPGDMLIGISTSGNSPNILKATQTANDMSISSLGLLGKGGGKLASMVDLPLVVQSQDTARIQEAHIFLLHYLSERMETSLMEK